MENELVIVIMAGGEGKRMNSTLPKVLHYYQGIPMLVRIIQTVKLLNPYKIIVITGKHTQIIKETVSLYAIHDIAYVNQPEPLGTGHAIKCTLPYIKNTDKVMILNGDTPIITENILRNVMAYREPMESRTLITIIAGTMENPAGYGRMICNESQNLLYIVEEKDCNEDERKVKIINSGIYYVDGELLRKYIPKITNENVQKEYYLTDIVKIIKTETELNIKVYVVSEEENRYIKGVNTQEELNAL
jgi:bifunctional UDP-N-acetylglucosamine pyrophosphorylase / glucosamine-1-phosphate N-acetyltransferase